MLISNEKVDTAKELKLRAIRDMNGSLEELMKAIGQLSDSVEKSILVFYNSLALFESSFTTACDIADSFNESKEGDDKSKDVDPSDSKKLDPV
jgi:hypothetical protein